MIENTLLMMTEQAGKGKKMVVVSVTETMGSSPATAGQMMVVFEDGKSRGTVGGGESEFQIIQQALTAMKQGEKVFCFNIDHSENGMVCGGRMAGFGTVLGNHAHLLLFGGGHIGQSLSKIARVAGFSVTVVEDRQSLSENFENVQYVCLNETEYEEKLKPEKGSYAVIATRGHVLDQVALEYCLKHHDLFSYVGMVGSRKKVTAAYEKISKTIKDSKEIMDKFYTPIGLDIASSVPGEIAIGIMAEILAIKNKGTLQHKRMTV